MYAGLIPAQNPDLEAGSYDIAYNDVYIPDTGGYYQVEVTAPAWRDLWPWLLGALVLGVLLSGKDSKR